VGFHVTVQAIEEDRELTGIVNKAFVVRMEGSFDALEPRRRLLAQHLKQQSFECVYILIDDVSRVIAQKLYPDIYDVENRLRSYLIQFMTVRLGPRWWDITATGEIKQKVQQRRNNELVFGQHIDNRAYLIDFSDLGRFIYAHSSGYSSKEEIVQQLDSCDTIDALSTLKTLLQTNYQRFFKETFKDRGFQAKWESLEKLRHRVAHNSLFLEQDLIDGAKLCGELKDIIKSAEDAIREVAFTAEEREAIRGSFVAEGYFDVLTREKFLDELARCESRYNWDDAFVGLKQFVKDHLGTEGYDYHSSYELAEQLRNDGIVEFYQVDNSDTGSRVTAIRRTQSEANLAPVASAGPIQPITRIYSLAKQLKMDSKVLVDVCFSAGVSGKGSALASLTDEEVARIKEYLNSNGNNSLRRTLPR